MHGVDPGVELAMMEFLNPILAGGLAAVAAPVIIHLWHRRKVKRVDWGAMRFLVELMARSRRRLFVEELLLLLVRALVVAAIALAMLRPALQRRAADGTGRGLTRVGRTASVLLIDDSLSSTAGRAQPAFEYLKKLALAYVETLAPGDEVSVLCMSQLAAGAGDPLFDLEGVKSQLASLQPSFVASDVPALLEAGLRQLKRHINPGAELVLVTDGRKDGWHEEDKARWEAVRDRLRGGSSSALGSRSRPQLLVLSPAAAAGDDNLAISDIAMDHTLISVDRPVGARVTVINCGRAAGREATVRASVNGQIVGSKRVEIPAGGRQEVFFPCGFPAAGSYSIEAALVDPLDLLPADDRRAISIQVEASVPVLLVEGASPGGLDSKLGFLAYALEPELSSGGAFKVTRVGLAQFAPATLADYRVLVLGDLPVLEPAMVDALERFVVGGGGILVGLGPDSDLALINQYWARSGEGFLPCPLERAVTPAKPCLPAGLARGHPVFSGFGAQSDEAWKGARVRTYCRCDPGKLKEAEVLLHLDGGDPLIVERRRGLGLVALMTTSLNADWTDLPLQAAYVPLMRGVVGRLGSFVMPPRNLLPGAPIIYAPATVTNQGVRGEDPAGRPLKLTSGAWEGRDATLSDPLMEPGVYLVRDPAVPSPIRFAVAADPAESALQSLTDAELSRPFDNGVALYHRVEEITAHLSPVRRQSVELWKWFLLAAVGLLFVETWLTRREAAHAA